MALGAHRLAEQATGQGQGVSPPPALGTGDKVAVSGGLVSQCPMHKPSRADLSFFPLLSSLKHHGVRFFAPATPKVITFHSLISSLRHISFRISLTLNIALVSLITHFAVMIITTLSPHILALHFWIPRLEEVLCFLAGN
eukprot:scaffold4653_cov145-Skeletonema_marinoi.AAC.1